MIRESGENAIELAASTENGRIDVDRLPRHASGDDRHTSNDHRRYRKRAQGGADSAKRGLKAMISGHAASARAT